MRLHYKDPSRLTLPRLNRVSISGLSLLGFNPGRYTFTLQES